MRFRLRVVAAVATAVTCVTLSVTATAAPASATPTGMVLGNYMPEGGTSSTAMCVTGGSTVGSLATAQVCTGSPGQQWFWRQTSGDYGQLVNSYGVCLGVKGGNPVVGQNLVVYTCYGINHPDQFWMPDAQYACAHNSLVTFYPFVNDLSGMVMGVQGGNMKQGQPLVEWAFQFTCNNQDWGNPDLTWPGSLPRITIPG